ncbi:TPA: type-F conjugative transfer system mating-pair stabilization protein TraN [Escherichia coli]|nr:type-F conjugative transfer system mating-pair stabilization protein TraN [Escherichia coli]HEL7987485.1 type-F conjugative transfer system mating-pair stabilization protein TraN [Escherichia coli]HEL8020265.1 type-F conjugative transfer system mating-pair stabilization protein TraN [Escherichia coli]HEL8067662.1 type-F conjugative transfer system mating-pair stabilization protein TraN [Escherichia coli]HEL8086607.1 type-F conjugative transfer system mating-pair stabilization protein TraN [E
MKPLLLMLLCTGSVLLSGVSGANEYFNAGTSWGSQNKGQGSSAVSGFDPAASLPEYTENPPETSYYGGVTSSGVDMTSPGSTALNSSAVGQTITESILNTPADNTPSLDAPYIASGLAMKEQAETITGGGFEGCVDQVAGFTELTTHQCLRDTKIEQNCTRTAAITGHYEDTTETKQIVIESSSINFIENDDAFSGSFKVNTGGQVISASAVYSWNKKLAYGNDHWFMRVTTPFGLISMDDSAGSVTLSSGMDITDGQSLTFSVKTRKDRPAESLTWYNSAMAYRFTVTLTLLVPSRQWVPDVVWTESCPFSKDEGTMTGSQCVESAETRSVVVDGNTYSIHQDCWKWQDTYLTQTETEGTCSEYISDSACSVISSGCADTVDGFCVSQQVTYSCERTREGNGKICGGEFFCTDGSCAQAQTGTSNMFGQAVSALAAVVAAGEDVAELNGENVRAFTGEAKSCKKFAAGFNNCCKDSGWGQDIGLSSCSSDEKALGEAKEKKLTVYVGEYCSKSVLGVCLEKKRGYCQFDSKLARIVQDQGRRGQLGIGFGSGKSPDCRGITVDELQQLNFGVMDFSDFYSDLDAGSNIPEDQALLQKAQDIIAQKLQENTP